MAGAESLLETKKSTTGKKIIIIKRTGGIGDFLMLTPSLAQLKANDPSSKIILAVDQKSNYNQFVSSYSFINKVIDYNNVVFNDYDECIDVTTACIQYEIKEAPPISRVDLYASHLGIKNLDKKIPLGFNFLQQKKSDKPVVGLHISSDDKKRDWPVKHYVSLIRLLQKSNCKFLIFDHKSLMNPNIYNEEVVNCSDASIIDMFSLINDMSVLVCPDSGLMHIAAAQETPCVALFGSTLPAARIADYPLHTGLSSASDDCLGCWYAPCDKKYICMSNIKPETVGKEVTRILNENMF